ncbi:AcrB/AcrD/AcrF family protein [Sphingomonas daechungensis]|uniref:AcrB/AcrD/AcrF family protein n=1 Tax=Sphingomonas daechungensis TaxID=1176646 RepID=UPI003784F8C5
MNRLLEFTDRYWKWIVVGVWLGLCGYFLIQRWTSIQYFALGDTDDNLRMSQVRALLAGQNWFDLRQYRLNPPYGANIHWSRLVDLPLAGIILALRPIVGGITAEKTAIAIAPLLPLLVLLFSLALIVRRLVDRHAYPLVFVALFFAGSALNMYAPTRIDHHGWQLALLALAVAGIADPKRARGGAIAGIASAMSLWIGLEMIIYLAVTAGAMALFWVADLGERRRLSSYAVTFGGGTAFGFLAFASYANRLPVCDALSPVWLSDALLGSALLLGLSMVEAKDWKLRFVLALGAGIIVAAFHALVWPHCLTRLEGISPEVYQLWMSHVREARPLYRHGWQTASAVVAIPLTGLVGWGLLAWTKRSDPDLLRRILAVAAPGLAAILLLLWQTRTGPAAQVLGLAGATALLWVAVPKAWNAKNSVIRVLGTFLLIIIGLGAAIPSASFFYPVKKKTAYERSIDKANRQCASLWGMRPVAKQPKGMVFTFVDLGPRLITVTHHDTVTGPYHRNGDQIADVMKAFRGGEPQAHAIVSKYRSDYVLICPNMSTATIFRAEAKNGFYNQLVAGKVPSWLTPVALPKDSPFLMWRVKP